MTVCTFHSLCVRILRQDIGKPWYDEQGVLNIGLVDFLLDRSVME